MNVSFLSDMLSEITARGRRLIGAEGSGRGQDILHLCDALLSGRGEASGVAIARDILDRYATLDEGAQLAFFEALARNYGADREKLAKAIDQLNEAQDDDAVAAVHTASEPRRQELIRRLNLAQGGTAALVAMRTDLLVLTRAHPHLRGVDSDFARLFTAWFNRGFLMLQRIDWNTPAAILERIIRYEAVHEIHDWEDLRRRIDMPDRRLYAFFHPTLVDDPLIFVEVALTAEIPGAIAPILATTRQPITPDDASTAVFYSISNCQIGLRGISFGNFLIKQVVEELSREFPGLKTFVTLSPVPDFMRWLRQEQAADRLSPEDAAIIDQLAREDWRDDPKLHEQMRRALSALAAQYFLRAKTANGRPIDSVARFHLGNGARLERLNWLGDLSPKGLGQSAGLMVNYQYVLKDIEKNHEAFANDGEVIAASAVKKLLRPVTQAANNASQTAGSE